jgi:putative endonuclease
MANFYVYIVTNKKDGVLYIGLTNELERRIGEHKNKILKGFTYKYNADKLVYFEGYETYKEAFQRERRLKKWNRAWKTNLIEKENPNWTDLSAEWF